jgi:hypothetical protein
MSRVKELLEFRREHINEFDAAIVAKPDAAKQNHFLFIKTVIKHTIAIKDGKVETTCRLNDSIVLMFCELVRGWIVAHCATWICRQVYFPR